jgi:hypothetical protein
MDSAASNIWKKLSWANLKTAISSTFVTLAGVSQTLSGKVGLGVTPTEKLSVAGNVNISGSYLYGNSAVGPVEVYGFFTDFTGYGQGGLPALVPGSFDRLRFLDKKGGTITSSITPATGAESLVYIVDGTAAFAVFDATGSPVVITMTLESAYSNQRDFSIIFYPGYAPSSFTVQFYDASDALLGQDVQTAWPSTQSVYVFKTSISFYGTKKVIITLNAPKSGYSYYHIFSVFWSNYGFPQSPSSVNRKFGGDVGSERPRHPPKSTPSPPPSSCAAATTRATTWDQQRTARASRHSTSSAPRLPQSGRYRTPRQTQYTT